MKRLFTVILILVLFVALGAVVLRYLGRARPYSGPGVHGNLQALQLAKEQWLADGNTNEWPTGEDLGIGSSPGKTFSQSMRPRYGEIYLINQVGAPPFAYFPKAAGPYDAGEIAVLTPTGLMTVRQ